MSLSEILIRWRCVSLGMSASLLELGTTRTRLRGTWGDGGTTARFADEAVAFTSSRNWEEVSTPPAIVRSSAAASCSFQLQRDSSQTLHQSS